MERVPSVGAMLITAPSADERVYEMAVRIAPAEWRSDRFDRQPWIRITANVVTGEVALAAGVKVKRKEL
jgi:hypothetical protein